MPWSESDAESHTRKADTPARRKLWAKVANRTLAIARDSVDSDPEGLAIRTANSVVARSHHAR